jgi:DNA polymerase-3 subunit gamma/tau
VSYLVLARKYRPQTFDQVVKQDHITRTLANAISSDRVAHAILFSGPGVPLKTTVARILAKALNCKNAPTSTPCDQCRSCKEIKNGSAVDVYEIDGASNNSVDQVRELRENIKYMPAHSPYKIYIIDEVHMLSIAAFNALLKTLEEPPPQVLFMFATTEPHKIPITILSRCQRHEFRRIDIESIQNHLEWICTQEKMKVAAESLWLIAREASGSMRDALSLLDQIFTCCEEAVNAEDVIELLGVIDRKTIFDISDAVLSGELPTALALLDHVYDRGFDLKKLYTDLVEHFRNLCVVKMGKQLERLVDLPTHEIESIKEQVSDVAFTYLNQMFHLLLNEEPTIRMSIQPKLAFELAFIRMCQIKPALPLETLVERLDDLQAKIGMTGIVTDKPKEKKTPDSGNKPSGSELRENTAPSERTENPTTFEGSVENLDRIWKRIIDMTSEQYPFLAATLSKCDIKGLTRDGIEIKVNGNDFNRNQILRPKNIAILEKIIRDVLGRSVRIEISKGNSKTPNNQEKRARENRLKQEALSHPLVAEAVEIFNGKVVDVKIL